MDLFIKQGARNVIGVQGKWGYEKRFRHVIPLEFNGYPIELLITSLDVQTYVSTKFDIKAGALVYDLINETMVPISGIDACSDIEKKRIDTIIDPSTSLNVDLSRFFRWVRLMVKCKYHLSDRCKEAISKIAQEEKNAFSSMNFDQFCRQIRLTLNADKPNAHIKIFHKLGVLDKIINQLTIYTGENELTLMMREEFLTRVNQVMEPDMKSSRMTCGG